MKVSRSRAMPAGGRRSAAAADGRDPVALGGAIVEPTAPPDMIRNLNTFLP